MYLRVQQETNCLDLPQAPKPKPCLYLNPSPPLHPEPQARKPRRYNTSGRFLLCFIMRAYRVPWAFWSVYIFGVHFGGEKIQSMGYIPQTPLFNLKQCVVGALLLLLIYCNPWGLDSSFRGITKYTIHIVPQTM